MQSVQAEASYGNGYIIHTGEIPSASAMFEETIHFAQAKRFGEISSSDAAEMFAREVAANRKLLKSAKAYGFTAEDINEIKHNLGRWEKAFEMEVGKTYDDAGEYHRGF